MKLTELYKETMELLKETEPEGAKEALSKLFDEKVKIKKVGADEKLATVRAVNEGCIKKVGEYEYLDYGLQKITFNIAILSRSTDIELDGGDEDGKRIVSNYDMALNMGLFGYLWDADQVEMEEFESFLIHENKTVEGRNSLSAILANRKTAKGGSK